MCERRIKRGVEPSLERGERGERNVGERGNRSPVSYALETSHTVGRVPQVKHTDTAVVQPRIHVVRVIHIPRTCPDWTRSPVSV